MWAVRSFAHNPRRRCSGDLIVDFEKFPTLLSPLVQDARRQAQDNDVEEAANQQAQYAGECDRYARRRCKFEHGAEYDQPTTAASLKIGRYMPITMLPTSTPIITMMNGSSRLASASTALLTSIS